MLAVRRSLAGLLIVLGLGTIAYALLSSETEEEAIERKLATVADAVGIREDESLLFRRARLNSVFKATLGNDVSVLVPDWGLTRRGRDEILQLATRVGTRYPSGTVELNDLDVALGPGADRASVTATATLTSTRGSHAFEQQSRGVQFELSLKGGDWYVDTITVASAVRQDPMR